MPINVMSYLRPANGNKWFLIEDSYVKGSLKVVPNLAALELIDVSTLVDGALAFVPQTNTVYQYNLADAKWSVMYRKQTKISVIGDSISAEYAVFSSSWPSILEQKLIGIGADVSVRNAAIGGSTFTAALTKSQLNASDASFKFGDQSQVDYACANNPDLILVVLGFNDVSTYVSDTGVNIASRQTVYNNVDMMLSQLRLLCPYSTIVCIRETVYDAANFNVNTAKNKHVIPFLWGVDARPGFQNTRNAELGEQLAPQRSRTHIVEMNALYAHIAQNTNVDSMFDMDYWSIMRIGASTIDLLHPDANAMLFQASSILDNLVTLYRHSSSALVFPEINSRDYAPDQFQALVTNTLVPSGDGYTERAEGLFNYYTLGSGKALRPNLWWSPVRPSIQVANYAADDALPIQFNISGAVPLTDVWLSPDGINWPNVGKTDANGNYFVEREPRQLLLAPGQHNIYVKLTSPLAVADYGWNQPCVFGPFALTVAPQYQKRMVVIGDSMSVNNTDSDPSWPVVLEEKLNGLGANVKVFDVAIGGSTFGTALDATYLSYQDGFAFGALTKLQYTISLHPDIVVVQLGANDSSVIDANGVADPVKVAQVHANIDQVFTTLRQQLPNATIIYSRQIIHDVAHWSATPKNKHFAVPLYWSLRSDGTPVSGARSAQNTEDALSPYAQGMQRELVAIHNYIDSVHVGVNVDYAYSMDYFKVSRMGGLGSDLVHPNGIGSQMIASLHFKNMQSVTKNGTLIFPNLARTSWNILNSFDALFASALTEQGDGYIEKFGTRFNFVNTAYSGKVDPYYWWCDVSPDVSYNRKLNTWPFLMLNLHGLPGLVDVDFYINNAWVNLGKTNSGGSLTHVHSLASTNAFEFYLRFASASWDSPSPLWSMPTVLGPFSVVP